MIELQKLLFPAKMEKEKRALYYDSKEKLEYGPANGEIFLQDGQKIVFDTYLNSFSAGKWKKYTMVTEVSLKMIFQGKFRIVLYHKFLHQGVCHTKKISEQIIEAEKKEEKILEFGTLEKTGIFSDFSCRSIGGTGILYGGAYVTKDVHRRRVHLGLNICTFKREAYVERNMKILRKAFLENPDSELYGKISVYIAD